MTEISALQKARASYNPKLPKALQNGALVNAVEGEPTKSADDCEKVASIFKSSYGMPVIEFSQTQTSKESNSINAGVILSGGQAPGGHNVIAGIFDGLKSINSKSRLFGFLGGPGGLVENKYIELTADIIEKYRNTGGFDIIGSGRTKLETEEQFEEARQNCQKLDIQALVVIGGDDSNTNACLLAEYYASKKVPIQVIGCPKTIDGDLKNDQVEVSFGFDTACRVYSELIGNIQRDANSAKKYWHFIKLMGRSASHIALECALQTHPNIALISEEVASKKQTLLEIAHYIADIVEKRSENEDNFGIALIPEGLIEFIPEIKNLISDLNDLLVEEAEIFESISDPSEKISFLNQHLDKDSSYALSSLPSDIQMQLAMDRDPHGNVQVSKIETEKLLAEMVALELKERSADKKYKGKFSTQTHFFGYEGRCAAPSNFDADYCYGLGYNAAALIESGKTGYMSSLRNLTKPAEEWIAGGIPITMMMNIERRHGEDKPVIKKALVELDGKPFTEFANHRSKWAEETHYLYPGPIQYFGPSEVCDQISKTIELENC